MLKRAQSAAQSLPHTSPRPNAAEEAEYAALEAALQGSALGRRFLADYARQHPTPEVQLLLDAISRLETAEVELERRCPSLAIVSELVAMSDTICQMRREIGELCLAAGQNGRQRPAPSPFDRIVDASARATSDILMALEDLQNVSWSLRETGAAPETCDRLDESAAGIYTACARHEMAAQKQAEAMGLLHDMETRIDALIEGWSDHETRNLMDAAKALDVSAALEPAPKPNGIEAAPEPGRAAVTSPGADAGASPARRGVNRLAPETDGKAPPAHGRDTASEDVERFERPPPLTFDELHAKQRTALFG